MYKRIAVAVNHDVQMWTDDDDFTDRIDLRWMGQVVASYIRKNPPNGVWEQMRGSESKYVEDQNTNMLLTILWFNGK